MFVVIYKRAGWLNCQQQVFGPFADHDTAYEFMCALPSPSHDANGYMGADGHKFIEELRTTNEVDAVHLIHAQDAIARTF